MRGKPKPDIKSPEEAESPLWEEIADLSRLLRDQGCRDCSLNELEKGLPLLLVARLLRPPAAKDWKRLAALPEFKNWIALPVESRDFPALTALQDRLDTLAHQSDHDPLTGLVNRRGFDRIFKAELDRAKRQNLHLSLAVVDVDHFKSVNDRFGHPCGDLVLKELAGILAADKRVYDTAARTGGEEFALILPGAGPRRAGAVVDRMLDVFRSRRFECESDLFSVTFSAGIAHAKGGLNTTAEEFVKLADKALYQAKAEGRNRIVSVKAEAVEHWARTTMVRSEEKRFLFG